MYRDNRSLFTTQIMYESAYGSNEIATSSSTPLPGDAGMTTCRKLCRRPPPESLLEENRLDGGFVGLIVERLSADKSCQDDEPQRRGQNFIHDFNAARFLVELADIQSTR